MQVWRNLELGEVVPKSLIPTEAAGGVDAQRMKALPIAQFVVGLVDGGVWGHQVAEMLQRLFPS